MTLNIGICIQYEITKRIRLLSLLNSIRKNTKSYNKKENEKENVSSCRDTTNNKRERTRKHRIRILERTMNVSGR